MILVTTTRHATPPVRRLAREIAWSLGFARKVNRGRMSLDELLLLARRVNASRIIIIGRGLYGNPGRLLFLGVSGEVEMKKILFLHLKGVVFSGMRNKPPLPAYRLPIVSLGVTDDVAERIALGFDALYLGRYSLEELRNFKSYSRVIAIEPINRKGLVLKFLERGEPLGPRLLVKTLQGYV